MTPIHTRAEAPALEVKGSIMTVIVLHLKETDPDRLYPQLEKKMGKAQAFFKNAPILIDLGDLDQAQQASLNFMDLATALRGYGVVPVGVRDAAPAEREHILQAGLGLLPAVKAERTTAAAVEQSPTVSPEQELPAPAAADAAQQPADFAPTKVITSPVRSGQQVLAPQGDLVILSSVNAGAEVLAAGNIHVYGALRGRAMAGIKGDTTARIFSLQCNPELVAIAGEYLVNEALDQACLNHSVMVSLLPGGLHLEVTGSFAPAP